MKMDNEEFIKRFSSDRLGRKTVHGTLYVQEFDDCKILMTKKRSGAEIVGVFFKGYGDKGITIFNTNNTTWYNYGSYPVHLSTRIGDMEEIENSRLIEYDDEIVNGLPKNILLKLGTNVLYFEPDLWTTNRKLTFREYMEGKINFSIAKDSFHQYKFGKHITSIEEAKKSLVPSIVESNPGNSFSYNKWWFVPQPDFNVDRSSWEVSKKIVENPPMPWEYGLNNIMVKYCWESPSIWQKLAPDKKVDILGDETAKKLMAYERASAEWKTHRDKINIKSAESLEVDNINIIAGKALPDIIYNGGMYMLKGKIGIGRISDFYMEETLKKLVVVEDLNIWHAAVKHGDKRNE